MMERPDPNEYDAYYERYISLVPAGPLVTTLGRQLQETVNTLRSVPDGKADFRYAAGKWSLKEVVGHINDTERIFAYRLLRAARGDRTPLEGYDQAKFSETADFTSRALADLTREFQAVRQSTIALAESLSDEAWSRNSNASGSNVSSRALGYIIAGHERHHLKVIHERYLG